MLPGSQRNDPAVAILSSSGRDSAMRAYITASGIAVSLVVVWAALVPFVA